MRVNRPRQAVRRACALAAVFAIGTAPAAAHDYWLEAERFRLSAPGEVRLNFRVGHGDDVQPATLRWDRAVGLRSHGPGGVRDQQASFAIGAGTGLARPRLEGEGTHVIAYESHHAFSELEAAKFDKYAAEEGLGAIVAARAGKGGPGRELYSRRAKALVQVGATPTDNATEPVGHTLEIVPELNPYALGADRKLPIRVMFRGRPLPGAQVDLTELNTGKPAIAVQKTGADGRAAFTVPERGMWKLNVIWGVPNPGNARAEYETVFASLTFGFTDK